VLYFRINIPLTKCIHLYTLQHRSQMDTIKYGKVTLGINMNQIFINEESMIKKNKSWIAHALFVLLLCLSTLPASGADVDEPHKNPWLADSPWPMTHRNPYCQASSPYPGPDSVSAGTQTDFTFGNTGLITIAISGPYRDGKRVLWGSSSTTVFKADPQGRKITYIDKMLKKDLSITSMVSSDEMLSGAYTVIDCNNVFYVPRFTRLYAYGDAVEGDPYSDIKEKRFFEIPANRISDPKEKIVGLNMTYDGMIAFVTSHGLVGVVSRTFSASYFYSLGDGEAVSNSIACDEDGGIYVVTSKKMYRVQWTGKELTTDETSGGWAASYDSGEGVTGVRLGVGSGSTPTLMGTGNQDKFVCITDGQSLMNIVLFWRGAIPSDWRKIEGTKDRRIAAQVPVTFGDSYAKSSLSEQSVCVRGYGALVVNNQLKMTLKSTAFNMLLSGISSIAPYGAEKYEWDPVSRSMVSVWVNTTVSFPNGIPCMSSATNLMYCVGQGRLGSWTFEALDWNTGGSVFSCKYGATPACNSAFAATEIGLNGSLYSGTLFGIARMKP